ncbi:hypothetical protein KW805_02805 [Candidatus Pacearchaeota archaeon]|nr:hypothetical protein [Candidatus Pacearchaeota archaeon]
MKKTMRDIIKHELLFKQSDFYVPLLPKEYLRKLREFVRRNAISSPLSVHGDTAVCEQCLKAYAITLSREMRLGERAVDYVIALFPGKTGHDGYYLDHEDLVKI